MNDGLLFGLLLLLTSSFCVITYKAHAMKQGLPMGVYFANEQATILGWIGLIVSLVVIFKTGEWLVEGVLNFV